MVGHYSVRSLVYKANNVNFNVLKNIYYQFTCVLLHWLEDRFEDKFDDILEDRGGMDDGGCLSTA